MDKQQAQAIIKKTFESPFDKVRFTNFIKNLLNSIDESKAFHAHGYVKEGFSGIIKTYERIGTYNSTDDKKIDIIIVYLQKGFSLDYARVTQRNFAGRYLVDRGEKDAGLFAFVSPDETDWRFSLVTIDYEIVQSKAGNWKGQEKFSQARRWSFLVGANEKSHTAQSRLVDILANDKRSPTLEEIEKAFDIETVTKEFFLKYRELFLRTKEALDKVVKTDSKIKADFQAKGVDTVNFAKKLLGQIVFLYFLQKKGWFGVGRDDDWGTGSKHFLRDLFRGKHGSFDNFFNDILEPLFYEALRIDRSHDDDYYSRFNCKIPFLNGGLFDPIGNYDWVHTDIHLPNDLFSNSRKTKEGDEGDGILDVFDRYNFTVREDEPLEKEVAIDPELLGKAYEKFNAIRPDNFDEFTKALQSGRKGEENKFNKKFGVYYTPREIVHYMCQQSLINYLNSELNSESSSYQKLGDSQLDMFGNKAKKGQLDLTIEHKAGISIRKEDIETLIHAGEQFSENEARVISEGRETRTYSHKLPESIRQNAALIDQKLAEITVCDPAVGSGAFPVGMMNEIVRARNVLSVFLNDGQRNDYEFKRRCIEHSLYGVDIDPGAVEIAKLRLWLSLVVDEEDIKNIKPLPNLDYKIVCGNSLLGVEKDLFNHQLFNDLEKLKPLFFKETNPTKKQKYKKQIDELISQITKGHTEFDFEVYFSEVFHDKGGFDVVIANPPYLKERDNKNVFEAISKNRWGKQWHQGKMDFWYFFLHKSMDIVKKSGVISFITSRYWLNSAGAKKLILRVKEQLSFVVFVDIGKLKVFDEVAGQHMVAVYLKSKDRDAFIYKKLENDFSDIDKQYDTDNLTIKIFKNSTLYFEDNIQLDADALHYTNVVRIGSIFDISQGVVQNPDKVSKKVAYKYNLPVNNGVFVLSESEFKKLNLTDYEKGFVKHFYDEQDIHRYFVRASKKKYLLYITKKNCPEIISCPNLKAHLKKYKKIMLDRRETKKGSNNWFHLHWPRESRFFDGPKIVLPAMFDKPTAAYHENSGYFGLSSNVIITKEEDKNELKFLLVLLNSKFAKYWFYKHGKKRGVGVDIGVSKLRQFPIKIPTAEKKNIFINIVDKILSITKDAGYLQNPAKQAQVKEYEDQIDQLVYQLYDLTEEEIRIVEGENPNDRNAWIRR